MNTPFSSVALGAILSPVVRPEIPVPGVEYRQIGVKWWGEGAYEREPVDGGRTQYKSLSRIETDDIVINKIWVRHGSTAVVPAHLAGCYVSGEFPTFVANGDLLQPRWIHWLSKTREFWALCAEKSQGTSGKNRIRPEEFLKIEIPLPRLDEQRRIIAQIEALATRIAEARGLYADIDQQWKKCLLSLYHDICTSATTLPMSQVARLVRRPVDIIPDKSYHELGIRSFGNGTFHKAPISGLELGSKRVFQICPGDLLFSNVFAWEGAIAVAKPEDEGRIGSHRFITCVPKEGVATSGFLCFHFLTPNGLDQIGKASPGGAGRNRTLNLDKLERLEVPVPYFETQVWFDKVQSNLAQIKQEQNDAKVDLDALLPSILDKAFRGEL